MTVASNALAELEGLSPSNALPGGSAAPDLVH
jgi:hypothetical protein